MHWWLFRRFLSISSRGVTSFVDRKFCFCVQSYLVQRFPQLVLSNDVESVVITLAAPALRVCLAQTDESPAEIIDVLTQTITILRRCCKATTRYCMVLFLIIFYVLAQFQAVMVVKK